MTVDPTLLNISERDLDIMIARAKGWSGDPIRSKNGYIRMIPPDAPPKRYRNSYLRAIPRPSLSWIDCGPLLDELGMKLGLVTIAEKVAVMRGLTRPSLKKAIALLWLRELGGVDINAQE